MRTSSSDALIVGRVMPASRPKSMDVLADARDQVQARFGEVGERFRLVDEALSQSCESQSGGPTSAVPGAQLPDHRVGSSGLRHSFDTRLSALSESREQALTVSSFTAGGRAVKHDLSASIVNVARPLLLVSYSSDRDE